MHTRRRREFAPSAPPRASIITADLTEFDAEPNGAAMAREELKREIAPWRHHIHYSFARILAQMPPDDRRTPAQSLRHWLDRNCRGHWAVIECRGTGHSMVCVSDDAAASKFSTLFGSGHPSNRRRTH